MASSISFSGIVGLTVAFSMALMALLSAYPSGIVAQKMHIFIPGYRPPHTVPDAAPSPTPLHVTTSTPPPATPATAASTTTTTTKYAAKATTIAATTRTTTAPASTATIATATTRQTPTSAHTTPASLPPSPPQQSPSPMAGPTTPPSTEDTHWGEVWEALRYPPLEPGKHRLAVIVPFRDGCGKFNQVAACTAVH